MTQNMNTEPFRNPILESCLRQASKTNQSRSLMSGTWQFIDMFFFNLHYDGIIFHMFPNVVMFIPYFPILSDDFPHPAMMTPPDRWVTSVLDQLFDRFLLLWGPGFLKWRSLQNTSKTLVVSILFNTINDIVIVINEPAKNQWLFRLFQYDQCNINAMLWSSMTSMVWGYPHDWENLHS